jgi:hypothetical protein
MTRTSKEARARGSKGRANVTGESKGRKTSREGGWGMAMKDASILKRTLYMVLAMLGASVVFVGAVTVVAVVVVTRAVGDGGDVVRPTADGAAAESPSGTAKKTTSAAAKDGSGAPARPASRERI